MSSIYDWSTTAASNANADANINWAEGMPPSAVNNSAREMMARAAEFRNDIGGALTAGGTANALTVTANSAVTSLANGLVVALRAAAINTAAATLNLNGLGAKSIRKMLLAGESALVGGELQATGIYLLMYSTALNTGAGGWLLLNPTMDFSAFVTLTGAQTLTNKTLTSPTLNGVTINGGTMTSVGLNFPSLGTASFVGRTTFPTGSQGAPSIVTENNTDVGVYFPADNQIAFGVDGTHVGRFASTGLHITKSSGAIGTPGTSLYNDGLVQFVRPSNPVAQFNILASGSEGVLQEFMLNDIVRGSISISGSTTSFNSTSDARLKSNPRGFDAASILDRLKVYEFDWKAGGSGYGVYAQEAYEVFPDAVTKGLTSDQMWQVDYSKFVPLLLQEVKNLREEIRLLKAKG